MSGEGSLKPKGITSMSPASITAYILKQVILCAELFCNGRGNLIESARIYYETVSKDPGSAKFFHDRMGKDPVWWRRYYLIGKGDLCLEALYAHADVVDRLKNIPLADQELLVRNGVAVAYENGSHQLVSIDRLTPRQVDLAFDGPQLRTVAQQVAVLKSKKIARQVDTRLYLLNAKVGGIDLLGRTGFISLEELKSIVRELSRVELRKKG